MNQCLKFKKNNRRLLFRMLFLKDNFPKFNQAHIKTYLSIANRIYRRGSHCKFKRIILI